MKGLDAGFDVLAVDQAHRVVPSGQAGHEGLVALQAFFIQTVQFHNRFFMVIDPQVELGMVFIGMDAQGRAFLAEGQAIMDKCLEDLKLYVDGSQPLTFVIG